MLRTGVDLIEIERLQGTLQRHGQRFLQRVFTDRELSEVEENLPSLAARFAAKEAVAKALGCGIGRVQWQEIEVRRGEAGEPILFLSGAALALSDELGLQSWSISLSHTQTHAIAMAVAIKLD